MIRLRRGVQSFGLLAILLGLWGCGGQPSVPPPEPQQVAAAPVAPAPPPVEPPPAEPEPAAVPLAPAPEKPSRPEDVSQWQADDFRAARREADPRLPEAIRSLGQRSSKDASVVPLLVELIEVAKPKENAGDGTETAPNLALRPGGGQGAAFASAEVIAATIAALGNNSTTAADQVLERLLAGQLDTGAQLGTVTGHVLDALVAQPSPEHDELLLTVAFTPEKFLAAAPAAGQTVGGGRDGMQLRRDVLERLRAGTSPELKTRLAERLPAEPLSAEEQQPFVDLLLEPLAENVRAQLILIGQPKLEPATRLKLQGLFSQLVAASLNRLLGIPEGVRIQAPAGYNAGPGRGGAVVHTAPGVQLGDPVLPAGFSFRKTPEPPADAPGTAQSPPAHRARGAADAPADPDAPAQLARIFWDAPVVQALLAPAALATSLDEVLPVAVLAAAIPQQEVRAQLARLNKGMWNEGTKDLPLGTLFGEYLCDPGLLVVVKQVPRKEDPAKVEARKATPTETRRAARARQRPANPATNEKELPRYEWMQASEEFVYVLNQRFHAAALARKGAAAAGDQPVKSTSEAPAAGAQSAAPIAAEPAVPIAAEPAVPKAAEPAAKAAAAKQNSPAVPGDAAALDRPEDDAFGTAAKAAATKAPAAAAMPVELHEGANVVAEYHLNWPADLAEKLAGVEVSPLVIHYVRIEETGRSGKLLGHYRKFLKGKETALRYIDKGRWIDHLDGGTAAGRKRSVDVMITSANREENPAPAPAGAAKASDRTKSGDEPLVVEILSIEIPDPMPEPADNSRPKPAEAAKRPVLTQ